MAATVSRTPDRYRDKIVNLFMAGTTRQLKFAKLIQKEISDIFQRDKRGILDHAFVTVADVRVSPDLGLARIYVSMMLAKDKQAVLDKITKRKGEIRKALGNKIGKQVRIIPELIFYLDEVEENAQRMDSLINNLNIPKASKEEE
jgi:ribosome-binding factor A